MKNLLGDRKISKKIEKNNKKEHGGKRPKRPEYKDRIT